MESAGDTFMMSPQKFNGLLESNHTTPISSLVVAWLRFEHHLIADIIQVQQ